MPVRRPVAAPGNAPMGAGNAATAKALSSSTMPSASWAASAQDGQRNASVAALHGQPVPTAQQPGGEKPGLLGRVGNFLGSAKSFAADQV